MEQRYILMLPEPEASLAQRQIGDLGGEQDKRAITLQAVMLPYTPKAGTNRSILVWMAGQTMAAGRARESDGIRQMEM